MRELLSVHRMAGHHHAEDELVDQEEEIDSESEEEISRNMEDGPLEGNLDQIRSIQKQVSTGR